ncbi:MAG: PQQ-binding-like beta-propeller repeat protein [Acidimicrobiales bacterium]
MNGPPDGELLANTRLRRRRSRLFAPLVLLSSLALGVVGYRTIVPLLNSEAATPVVQEASEDRDVSQWQCRSAVERAEQLPAADPTPVWLPALMARSELVVSGKITDGLLYDDFGVTVVEVEVVDGAGDEELDRLILPLSDTPAGAPWQGADFVAFLTDVSEFAVGTVAPGGFFFACGFDEPATGLALFDPEYQAQTGSLNALVKSYLVFEREGERQATNVVAPRVHVLDLVEDQSRVAVFLPEPLAEAFDVHVVDSPGEGQWHIVFSNNTVVGRIGVGACGDRVPEHCSGHLRMDIESLSGVDVPAALQFLGGPTVDRMQVGFGQPVVADRHGPQVVGELLLYLNDEAVFAVDNATLEPRWQHAGGPFTFARVDRELGAIVVRSELDGSLTGLTPAGTTAWRYPAAGTVVSDVDSDGPLLLQSWSYPDAFSRDRVLVALDPVDGTRRWQFSRDVPFTGAARVQHRAEEGLYVLEITTESPLTTRKEFIGLERATGEVRWRVNPQPGGRAFERDGYLWWAGAGRVARVDGETGQVLWQVDRGGIDDLKVQGSVVDLGDAGSFDLATGRRLRDAGVSPCC